MLKTDRLPTREEIQEHSKKAWDVYNLYRGKLERDHWGEYFTVNPYTKDYFVGKNHSEALDRAIAAYPDTVFHTIRIGHKAVLRRKGRKQ